MHSVGLKYVWSKSTKKSLYTIVIKINIFKFKGEKDCNKLNHSYESMVDQRPSSAAKSVIQKKPNTKSKAMSLATDYNLERKKKQQHFDPNIYTDKYLFQGFI